MTYKVAIRNNETSEVRLFEMQAEWSGDFWWIDGNGACDCNRAQFFDEAGGVDMVYLPDEEDFERYPCGASAYDVLYAELCDGSRIELEPDRAAPNT